MPQITLFVLFKEKLEKRKSRRLSKQVRLRNSNITSVFANNGVRSLEAQPGGRGQWVESTYGPMSMLPQRSPPPPPSLVPDVWSAASWPETPRTRSVASPIAPSPTPGTLMPDNMTISGVPDYQQSEIVTPSVAMFHPTPTPEDWATPNFVNSHRPASPAPLTAAPPTAPFPSTPATQSTWSMASLPHAIPTVAVAPPMATLVPNRLTQSSWSIASAPDSPESPATPPMLMTPATPVTPVTPLSLKNPFKRRPKQKPAIKPVASDSDDDDAYSWSASGKSKKSDWGHW